MVKICGKCKRELDIFYFHKHRSQKDGLNNWCKDCKKQNAKENKKFGKCIDCGIEKRSAVHLRCKSCSNLFKIKNNPNRYFNCIKCGKEKITYGEKQHSLCGSCACTGRIPSQETRKIWSKQRKGSKQSFETKQKKSLKQIGKKHSIESRTKASNTKTGLNRTIEEYQKYLEDLYKEGRREKEGKNFQYKTWAKSVKKRDKYICQRCFCKSDNIHAHHIKSWQRYPDFRFDINNGVCLCSSCHEFVHKNNQEGFIIL